jgi:hypothetical protein
MDIFMSKIYDHSSMFAKFERYFAGNLLVYKSEPKVRRVVPTADHDESDGNGDEDDSIGSSDVGKRSSKSAGAKKRLRSKKNGLTIDIPKAGDSFDSRDRFYKTQFRPKTFLINFHPQILDKFKPKNNIRS